MEIAALQFLLHANGFKEKSLASHIHIQKRQFPETVRDFHLFDMEPAPRIQMPQHAAAEFHLAGEVSIDFHESGLFGIEPQVALHRLKDASLTGGWPKVGIGREVQLDCAAPALSEAKEKGVWKQLEEALAMSGIVSLLLQ